MSGMDGELLGWSQDPDESESARLMLQDRLLELRKLT